MKAITVWQPWASLIVAGVKPYEFRGWPAPASIIGQRIAIHAGARIVRPVEIEDLISRMKSDKAWSTCLLPEALPLLEQWLRDWRRLPLSQIVGTAVLGQPVKSTEIAKEFGGPVNDSDRHLHSNYAWPMQEPRTMPLVDPVKGKQGFWDVPAGVEKWVYA